MYKVYSHILQGSEATLKNAKDHARGIDFSSCDYEEKDMLGLIYNDYKDTENGIDIYYNVPADYYFFVEEIEDNEEVTEDDYEEYLNNISMPEEHFILGGKFREQEYYADKYGTALRKYDEIAFNVGFKEYQIKFE